MCFAIFDAEDAYVGAPSLLYSFLLIFMIFEITLLFDFPPFYSSSFTLLTNWLIYVSSNLSIYFGYCQCIPSLYVCLCEFLLVSTTRHD